MVNGHNGEMLECKRVRDLAKALLQIEQSIERRFLRLPLGEAKKTPEKKKSKKELAKEQEERESEADGHHTDPFLTLHSWEKSLMSCTTLSQVFIHLQTLDESIAWSKSAMNARCRLCRRKEDAESLKTDHRTI